MSKYSSVNPAALSKTEKVLYWALCIFTSIAFFTAGLAKFAGVPSTVLVFEQIGMGQWFRILTALIEIGGAFALLVPVSAGVGGLLLATTMLFATLAHLFVIDGSPVPAIVLFAMSATIGWLHRNHFVTLFIRLSRI
ncbi:DoxX family protein [Pseudomonas tolaasii]|uniref:DoxX family protein n=2 Tax=Pseudomonas tolaasii TaxID=29442 RepID=A0A7Y8AJQ3_PSETO|nr:DoxX family protein [Pseudomonas tolaasii]ARB30202.1 DoxX family protein [Pseudomonas tolaasii]KAB0466398.1 DoxX family membrane protein [Pseudomonas tolaasii]MBW4793067.1 DoxX family protein [Pseudomonas tolaasii]MBY8941945.1 DoxX family protein [Pseudomonas tolaasii]NVZ45840.1 DoxX family protein [Pseudomonas tolaasii]